MRAPIVSERSNLKETIKMYTRKYFVYIATHFTNTVLYTGVTNNLVRRMYEHKDKMVSSFTSRYNVTKLVYLEIFDTIYEAIRREKQIKAGSRIKKLELIRKENSSFNDLYINLIK